MKRRWIRYGFLSVGAAVLVGLIGLSPASAAQPTGPVAGTTTKTDKPNNPNKPGKPGKPGKPAPNPCADSKPAPRDDPGAKDVRAPGKDPAAGTDTRPDKPGVGVIVCGGIAGIDVRGPDLVLTVRTGTGPATVRVTPDTIIVRDGDGAKVPRQELRIGHPVVVKGERSGGVVTAIAVLLV